MPTYYVKSGGSDAAAGTSIATAWATVSKVNSFSFSAGDSVQFEGGSSFGTTILTPSSSGSSGNPITFTSYGTGQANITLGISLGSKSWITIDNLKVDTGAWATAGLTRGVLSLSTGTGCQNIVIEDCSFLNVVIGLLIQNVLDSDWTVRRNLIQYVRDSGVLIHDPEEVQSVGGTTMTFEDNIVLDVGLDTGLTYPKHGFYVIGRSITIRNNEIRRFSDGAISLRSRNAVVEGNTISDGNYGIYHSAYDATAGTTKLTYNKITAVTTSGIEINSAGNVTNVESFTIANNTVNVPGAATGIRVIGTTGTVTIKNNVSKSASGYAYRSDNAPGGGYTENYNLAWSVSGSEWAWRGTVHSTIAAYRTASSQGANSLQADPLLDTDLTLQAGSPAIDAGTTVVTGLTYANTCTGAAYSYCSTAPDMGALESGVGGGTTLGEMLSTTLFNGTALGATVSTTVSSGTTRGQKLSTATS